MKSLAIAAMEKVAEFVHLMMFHGHHQKTKNKK